MNHSDCWSFYLAHRASRNKLETLRNILANNIEIRAGLEADEEADEVAEYLRVFLIQIDDGVGFPSSSILLLIPPLLHSPESLTAPSPSLVFPLNLLL